MSDENWLGVEGIPFDVLKEICAKCGIELFKPLLFSKGFGPAYPIKGYSVNGETNGTWRPFCDLSVAMYFVRKLDAKVTFDGYYDVELFVKDKALYTLTPLDKELIGRECKNADFFVAAIGLLTLRAMRDYAVN